MTDSGACLTLPSPALPSLDALAAALADGPAWAARGVREVRLVGPGPHTATAPLVLRGEGTTRAPDLS